MATREEMLAQIKRQRMLAQVEARRDAAAAAPPAAPTSPPIAPTAPAREVLKNTGYLDEDASGFDKFKLGLAESVIKTGLGVKSLFSDLTPTEKKTLELIKADVDQAGGWATAGGVVGDVAQFAVPGGAAVKGAKLLSKAKASATAGSGLLAKGAKLLPSKGLATVGGELGVAGAFGATRAPTEGKTRSEGATDEAIAAALGLGAGAVLGRTFKGIQKSDAAKYLAEKGAELTPGQAARNSLPRALEYIGSATPFVAKAFGELKDDSVESFSKAVLKEAAPPGTVPTKVGGAGVKQLRKGFKKAYASAWGKTDIPKKRVRTALLDETEGLIGLSEGAVGPVRRVRAAITRLGEKKTTGSLANLDRTLRNEIERALSREKPDHEIVEALDGLRETLMRGVSPEARSALKLVNTQFGKFAAARLAATRSPALKRGEGLTGGVFDANDLMTTMNPVGKLKRASEGEAPLYEMAKAGTETVNRKEPSMIYDAVKGVSQNVMSPTWAFRAGGNLMMGTKPQQEMRAVQQYLRRQGVGGAGVGAALNEDMGGAEEFDKQKFLAERLRAQGLL